MFYRMPKIVGSRDLSHTHFQGKLFVRLLGIPHIKLHTKFEVSMSSRFREVPQRQPHRLSGLATLPSVGAIP